MHVCLLTWLFFTGPIFFLQYSLVVDIVLKSILIFVVIEYCVIIYEYNLQDGRYRRFVDEFLDKDDNSLANISLDHTNDGHDLKGCTRELLLTVTNVIKLIQNVVNVYLKIVSVKYIITVHRLLTTILTLQWSMSLRCADEQISRAKLLVETSLRLLASPPSDSVYIQNTRKVLERLDNAVEVYRKASEKRNLVNDYYGAYILFYVSVSVALTLLNCFNVWRKFSEGAEWLSSFYLLTIAGTELFSLAITGAICESAVSEVR